MSMARAKLAMGLFLLVSTGTWAQGSQATGFSIGNDLEAISLRGDLTVHCSEGPQWETAYFHCTGELLDPAEYAYFVTEPGGSADQVTLTAQHESGKSRSKTKRFDARSGKSEDRFNLWIATLLQRPLLDYGVNKIHYSLGKKGIEERSGEFIATVRQGEARTCAHDVMQSWRLEDCRNSASACATYFARQDYCQ